MRFIFVLFSLVVFTLPASAQDAPSAETTSPGDVAIAPGARDDEIANRIARILDATGWYDGTQVAVDDGIVFLDGATDSDEHRIWARDLASKTEDVVAVVNRISVDQEADWTFAPAVSAMREVSTRLLTALPLLVLAMIVLPLTWWLSSIVARALRRVFLGRVSSPFLGSVVARLLALPVFLVGLYIVLQVAGLTQLAVSVVGGAGVIGIVFGFAFRDIAENFLASLLLSIRQPFRAGDIIQVEGMHGSVQSMNTRSTVLISPEGNHIQIPNATVFKSVITNFTVSPEGRDDFTVGIGYDASITRAQELIGDVLARHEAVLAEPAPMILVDGLGSSTVTLHAYYWLNVREYSLLKVKSSVLRLTKKTLMDAGISMPDDAREIIFPQGVPLLDQRRGDDVAPEIAAPRESGAESTEAEGDLANDQDEIAERAGKAASPEDRTDLLES